jgi:hypothetical protein
MNSTKASTVKRLASEQREGGRAVRDPGLDEGDRDRVEALARVRA